MNVLRLFSKVIKLLISKATECEWKLVPIYDKMALILIIILLIFSNTLSFFR